ncbi:MAG: DUF3846 domain-containing protein [Clostridia bacterium]|nr:DUF3846 domain-containing protein [Clostridia bacterium]
MTHSIKKRIRVLIVEPGKAPCPAEIPSDLASLQEKVGGLIQVLYPFTDPVAVICNVESCIMLSIKLNLLKNRVK